MAFIRRNKNDELVLREANGESFWSHGFTNSVKTRILYVFTDSVDGIANIHEMARNAVLRDLGLTFLSHPRKVPNADFVDWCLEPNDANICEAIERFYECISDHSVVSRFGLWQAKGHFEEKLRQILLEERISWDFVSGMMIPRDAQVAHSSILIPALNLLSKNEFKDANTTFLKGLEELSKGDAGDAITDFGTSLQLFLKAKGCIGDTLGDLKNYGVGRAILTGLQGRLISIIADIRNKVEVHNSDHYEINDAWFMCHLVASLMLQLENSYDVTQR